MYKVIITDAAEGDLKRSIEWYDLQQEGLSKRFLDSFFQTLTFIETTPNIYQERYRKNYRAAKMHRFPFLVVFKIKGRDIFVNAVFHTSRNPNKRFRK